MPRACSWPIRAWIAGDGKPPAVDVEQDPLAIARIILTSGTTGHPERRGLEPRDARAAAVTRSTSPSEAEVPACTRSFLDPGIAANFGFLWGLYTLARGGTLFLRGRDAAETLQALTLYNVQCMIAAPGGLAEILDYYERSPAFSSPFERGPVDRQHAGQAVGGSRARDAGVEPRRRLWRDRRQSEWRRRRRTTWPTFPAPSDMSRRA